MPSGGDTFQTFSGRNSSTDCGFKDGNKTTALFSHSIVDLAFDDSDVANWRMFAADEGNHRIRVLDKAGTVSTLAGSDMAKHQDGKGSDAAFAKLGGVTFDKTAKVLYVADGATIRKVAMDGTVTTLTGSTEGFKDGTGCEAKFGEAKGIVYNKGALFVVDTNRVRKIVLP